MSGIGYFVSAVTYFLGLFMGYAIGKERGRTSRMAEEARERRLKRRKM